jgi:uncharacterized protein
MEDEQRLNHDSVVADWQQNAEKHDEESYKFLRSLKHRNLGFQPDELAAELHQQAFQIVDCTCCANCCKTMTVKLDQTDINRIAKHLDTTEKEFIDEFLEADDEKGMYIVKKKPCPFLGSDDRCTIYDVRPTACREFPHTDKEGFATRTILHANNALKCPAVFWIIEQMRKRARR